MLFLVSGQPELMPKLRWTAANGTLSLAWGEASFETSETHVRAGKNWARHRRYFFAWQTYFFAFFVSRTVFKLTCSREIIARDWEYFFIPPSVGAISSRSPISNFFACSFPAWQPFLQCNRQASLSIPYQKQHSVAQFATLAERWNGRNLKWGRFGER